MTELELHGVNEEKYEIVGEEEVVRDTYDEVVGEEEEVVREESNEEVVEEEVVRPAPKGFIEYLHKWKDDIFRLLDEKDKRLAIFLILYRLEHAELSRIADEVRSSKAYATKYLSELEAGGLVKRYSVYPDTRTYYKLSQEGMTIAKAILQLVNM
ncbi:hypothetical protein [Metallosphaera sedula]|uniref:hypothetical protein n=1 Tax=Metallosphaera sedula TaxID=43687 RepID=UPI0020BE687A|nr:hypothetical protein [Metallosphaera sedula]BBL45984.1 hypothetical protein MJ1HA_0071 [Metallosphaera sedula]